MAAKETYPTGWHLMAEFVDVDGIVYFRGIEQPELQGTKPVTIKINKKGEYVYPPDYVPSEAEVKENTKKDLIQQKPSDVEQAIKDELAKKDMAAINDPKEYQSIILQLQKDVIQLSKIIASKESARLPDNKYVIQASKERLFGEGVDPTFVEESDYEKELSTFVVRGKGYVLSTYRNAKGQEILAPYNRPVYFQYNSSDIIKGTDNTNVIDYSVFATHSKKEKKFVRDCPLYGKTIFENINDVVDIDPEVSQKLEAITIWINSLTDDEVFGLAVGYQMSTQQGITQLRSKLANMRIEELLTEEKRIREKNARSFAGSLPFQQKIDSD